MNALFKFIAKDRILFWSFSASTFCNGLSLILLLIFLSRLPNLVPLYNQLPWGEGRLGTKFELLIPFALSILILLINVILSRTFYTRLPLVCRILSVTSIITSFLILAFLARTIQLIV